MTTFFNAGPHQRNIVSISGGKDSAATALICRATQPENSIEYIHCDTGHEHPYTVEYIDYLARQLDRPITVLRADFTEDFARKREYILSHWFEDGVPEKTVFRAAEILQHPTGIPFLDLCILHGRFPSSKARFCTTQLKVMPSVEHQLKRAEQNHWVWSWQGIRADESANRRHLKYYQDLGNTIAIYRPILRYTAQDVFDTLKYAGIKPNPLYTKGMKRVGCMPCINCGKDELTEISHRYPWAIDKLKEWEHIVSTASKRGAATFFHRPVEKNMNPKTLSLKELAQYFGVEATVQWARTAHGGKQYDIFKSSEPPQCSSAYGLCE